MSQTINVQKLIPKFLKYMENIKSSSAHTLKAYAQDLSQTFGKSPLVNEREILPICHQAQLRWSNLEPSSRNRKTAVLKSFLGYLFDEKLLETDLRHQLRSPRVPKKLPHFISVDEVLAVIGTFDSSLKEGDSQELQMQSLFYLLYGGGLRISEACGLKWSDFNWSQRTLRILGKGGKERLVVIPTRALSHFEKLRSLQKNLEQTEFVWGDRALDPRTGFGWIRGLGQRAGLLRPLNPHALRHSFATHLLTSGANLRTLQELLGHSSLMATEKYTHLTVDQLARTLEKHHPLKRVLK